jgi:hypothetical protein
MPNKSTAAIVTADTEMIGFTEFPL